MPNKHLVSVFHPPSSTGLTDTCGAACQPGGQESTAQWQAGRTGEQRTAWEHGTDEFRWREGQRQCLRHGLEDPANPPHVAGRLSRRGRPTLSKAGSSTHRAALVRLQAQDRQRPQGPCQSPQQRRFCPQPLRLLHLKVSLLLSHQSQALPSLC